MAFVYVLRVGLYNKFVFIGLCVWHLGMAPVSEKFIYRSNRLIHLGPLNCPTFYLNTDLDMV
jgi:hypothetical protein